MDHIDEGYQPGSDPGGDPPLPAQAVDMVAGFEAAVARSFGEGDPAAPFLPDRLCEAVVEVAGVQGVAVSVYLGPDIAVPIGASDPVATTGEALQFMVREGPCLVAYAQREPVLVPDLQRPDSQAWSRWPTYAEQLTRRTPYRAVFAYPLLRTGRALGSLSLYRHSVGQLDDPEALREIAERVGGYLLETGALIGADGEPEHQWMNGPAALRRRHVWLAQGLTLQVNGITPGQALELLRAQAFSADRLLDDIAEDIVAGRLPAPVLESQQ